MVKLDKAESAIFVAGFKFSKRVYPAAKIKRIIFYFVCLKFGYNLDAV